MINEIVEKNYYNVFIPSVQDYVTFKPLNILQYKKIIADSCNTSFLNLGFKVSLFEIFNTNKTIIHVTPTEYDLYCYGIYLRYFDISKSYKEQEIILKTPANFSLEKKHLIEFFIPTVSDFIEYSNFINNLTQKTANIVLLAELAKHYKIDNCNFYDKIERLKKYTLNDLNNLLHDIDCYKQSIKDLLYIANDVFLPFNSALILE